MNDEMINKNKILHLSGVMEKLVIVILALALIALTIITSILPVSKVYAAESREITLSVKQTFTSTSERDSLDDVFTYKLVAESPAAPMPVGSELGSYTFEIEGTKEAKIGPIVFPGIGVYTYSLSCTTIPKPGYHVDERLYIIEIYVPENEEGISVIYKSDEAKVSEMVFNHTYGVLPSDPAVMVDPPVQKTVKGNPPTGSTFSFKLMAEKPTYPMPAKSENGVKIMTIIGPGELEFGTWSYTQAGTYRYTVFEVDSKVPGYAYDNTIYTITDVVTAENGQLVVARTVKNNTNDKEVLALSFINSYTSPERPGSPNNPPHRPGSPGWSGTGPKTGDFNNLTKGIIIFGLNLIIIIFIIQVIRLQNKVRKPYHER